jgi:mono/diheme cytochrome c family protein
MMSQRTWHRAAPFATLAFAVAVYAMWSVPQMTVALQAQEDPRNLQRTSRQALFTRYCLSCHSQAMKQRGAVPIALDSLELTNISRDAETWEKVVRKVRTGMMPPPGMPRPDRATHDGFAAWIEGELDRAAAVHPNPGRTEPFHRLNRAEYRNVIRDLLHLEVDVEALLPSDDASYGFDNIAGVLKMSPTLMDRYLAAAQKIARLALGTPPPQPNVDYFRIADDLQQDDHLEGLPLGTRGGTAIRYTFPTDGEYEIRVRLARDLNESVPVYREPQHLEVSLDGNRLHLFTLPGVGSGGSATGEPDDTEPIAQPQPTQARLQPPQRQGGQILAIEQNGPRLSARERQARNSADQSWNVRVPIKAGERELTVTFLKITSALDDTIRLPFERPFPAGVNIPETRKGVHLRSVEIVGPYQPTGAAESKSRRRILVCEPVMPSEEQACARKILATLSRRAYRRPVTGTDVNRLLALYSEGRAQGSFEAGLERAIKRLLVSPEFLFRVERDAATAAPNSAYRISQLELASRLSFFLWSSIPDDALLDAAANGRLRQPAVLARQVKRMLADRRSEAFVKNFVGQWLYLRNLPATGPVATIFPDFDDSLRTAMQRETELFVDSIVRDDRGALELLSADYSFLNERLARHYGVPQVTGSHFRRVSFRPDSVRGGLLGQGSILTVTSHPDRTSPVVRGKWILENLLGTSPPPPPPNVPELKPTGAPGQVLSMRDRMAQHRANPQCAGCHAVMDPVGLALENLDGVGRYRTLGESSEPIDASGALPDGTKFVGPTGLKQALLTKSDQFVTTLTEKLLIYSLGRGLEYYDAPTVRTIVKQSAGEHYRFSSLILGIVQSAPFQMRRAQS